MTPEQRENTLARHLRFTARVHVHTWIGTGDIKAEDAEVQILAALLQACKQEAEAQELPFERIIAEVTRNESE